MWNNPHDAYVESRVQSAGPLELVRLLYQGAIGSVREARAFLAEGKIAERSRAISKTCEILMELHGALDHRRGGEIAVRLAALYQYMLGRLLEANLQQADVPLADVLGLLSTLAEAWDGVHPTAEPLPLTESPWQAPQETASAYAPQTWSL